MVAHVNNDVSYIVTDPTEQYFAKMESPSFTFHVNRKVFVIMKIYNYKNNKSHKFKIAGRELRGVIFDYIFSAGLACITHR